MSGPQSLKGLIEQTVEGRGVAFAIVDEVASLPRDTDGVAAKALIIRHEHAAPPSPVRAESPRIANTFHEAAGFCRWLTRECQLRDQTNAMAVFIDAPNARAYAVLDEDADEGYEVVSLVPQVHPRWAPWATLLNKRLSLDQLCDHVRDNRRSIADGRELVFALTQVRASTEVILESGRGKKALNGLMIRTTIQGVKGEHAVELPDTITVRSPIFVGSDPVDIELELILEGSSDGTSVMARFASADIREATIAGFEAISERLLRLESEIAVVVAFGVPEHKPWEYLKA